MKFRNTGYEAKGPLSKGAWQKKQPACACVHGPDVSLVKCLFKTWNLLGPNAEQKGWPVCTQGL